MPHHRVHLFHWNATEAGAQVNLLRDAGFETLPAAGLVDYKVCSTDSTWSGLRFTRRKNRAGGR